MLTSLGINDNIRLIIGIWAVLSAVLIVFPKTFFMGNVLRVVLLLLMMSFALKEGNVRFALIEIPFLLMPLVLIYLGHPFKMGFNI